MIEVTCIECGDKFDKYTGDMDVRMCLTCILKAQDPDVIKSDNVSYAEDIDQQAFAQGRQSSITDVHNEKDVDVLEKIADEVYSRIEKEEIRPVTYDNVILTGMDNLSCIILLQYHRAISSILLYVSWRCFMFICRIRICRSIISGIVQNTM